MICKKLPNFLIVGAAKSGTTVTTNVGGIKDYVNEDCAILANPGDAEMMAQNARCLLEDKELWMKMSLSARKKSLDYSWTKIAEKLRKVYASLYKL